MRVNCATRIILLDSSVVIILGVGYKLSSCTLRSFLQSPIISFLLVQKFSSAPCYRILSAHGFPLMLETNVLRQYQTTSEIMIFTKYQITMKDVDTSDVLQKPKCY
jgi:hypothetical protein